MNATVAAGSAVGSVARHPHLQQLPVHQKLTDLGLQLLSLALQAFDLRILAAALEPRLSSLKELITPRRKTRR